MMNKKERNLYFIADFLLAYDLEKEKGKDDDDYVREGIVTVLSERYSPKEINAIYMYIKYHYYNIITKAEYEEFIREYQHSDSYIQMLLLKPIHPDRYRNKIFCKTNCRRRSPKDYLD